MTRKFFLLFCLFWAFGCSPSPAEKQKKPLILVSIAPYRFLVEQIAGPNFEVQTVVPVNADPHSFEPTAHQVHEMTRSKIWFQIGEPFEGKILPLLKRHSSQLVTQDLRDGLLLIAEESSLSCRHCSMDHYDRHIWLSPKLAAAQAALIEKTLSEQFPKESLLYQKNLAKLVKELEALDREIEALLTSLDKRTILVSHPAFGYFCKDYQLEQLSIEYEGKEPRPQHLEQILTKAKNQNMRLAIALPQYNNKGAQLIAEKLRIPVRMIDPYSPEYFENLRKLAHLIADPYAQ
jgi:zinc transport system substrate-binding protein